MSQEAPQRPRCRKCNGFLYPSRDLTSNRVSRITCVVCGETLYRDHQRQAAVLEQTEIQTVLPDSRQAPLPRRCYRRDATSR